MTNQQEAEYNICTFYIFSSDPSSLFIDFSPLIISFNSFLSFSVNSTSSYLMLTAVWVLASLAILWSCSSTKS